MISINQAQDNASSNGGGNSSSLRILHIINNLEIGGAEMMLYRMLAHQRGSVFDPVVISLMDSGPLREKITALGISVYSPQMRAPFAGPRSIRRLQKLVARIQPDLIHGWLYQGSLAAQFTGSLARVPVVWSIHASMYSLSFEKRSTAAIVRICAPVSRSAAAVIFVSRTSQAQHHALGFSAQRSVVIPNGIDIDVFKPSEAWRQSVREELNLSESSLLIGLIGRYHPMKDHGNFLRAASRIAAVHPNVHFLLAGRDVDRSNVELNRQIEMLSLAGRIHLLGERTDIPRLIGALDILTLSSLYGESFPIIVGEAMACEVPCVVTDVGDSTWLIGETGLKVAPGHEEELASAWTELIAMGSEKRSRLGAAARLRIANSFSLPSIVQQYDALYLKIAKSDAPSAESSAGYIENAAELRRHDLHDYI